MIAVEESAFAGKKLRKYYLTKQVVTGSQALTACARKFHMASLWEIFNTACLQYDTQNGLTFPDSGSGAPANATGWSRTGLGSDNQSQEMEIANCNSWKTDTGFGTALQLSPFWNNPGFNVPISPWRSGPINCNTPLFVWCVQD